MIRTEIERTPSWSFLGGVPWDAYVLLREAPENYHVRMTYDRGALEIMSPSKRHEQAACMIGRLVDAWGEELGIPVASCRTMTLRREDLERGVEPDNCYYIQHESVMRARTELDLSSDPPPDLAIEIELSRHAIDKPALYAALGVHELWRFDGRRLAVYRLGPKGRYAKRAASRALPGFPLDEAERILGQLGTESDSSLAMSFRQRVRRDSKRAK
jgi:Uma2 family endonuclease